MTSPRALEPSERRARIVLAAVTLGATALYLRGFLAGRSLWADEASLALNFFDRLLFSFPSNEQVAPLGYMAAVHVCIALLGGVSVTALRLVSLLSAVGAIPLVYIATRDMAGRLAGLCAATLFALAPSIVYYSGEHKQYATESFVSALLLVVAARSCRSSTESGRLVWLSLTATVAVWFSLPAVFVVVGAFAAVLVARFSRADLARVLVAGVPSALSFLASQWWVRAHLETTYLQSYWADVYPTFDGGLVAGIVSWGRQVAGMFGAPLVPPMSHVTSVDPARALPNLLAPFALAGLVALALRRRWAAALVGGWIVAAGGAVVLQAYPFSGRLALYALPVTCAVSAAWVCIPRTRVGRAAAVAVFAAVALPLPAWMAITVARSPTEREEIHQVVMRLGAELEPGDVVYLYGRGWRQFEVYKRLGLPPVWAQATVVEASKAVVASAEPGAEWNVDERGRREVAIATSDLRRLAAGPQRVWAVFSHYMDTTDERRAVLGQLAPDHRVVKSIEATGAAADLID